LTAVWASCFLAVSKKRYQRIIFWVWKFRSQFANVAL
jgi:hypothetical protein